MNEDPSDADNDAGEAPSAEVPADVSSPGSVADPDHPQEPLLNEEAPVIAAEIRREANDNRLDTNDSDASTWPAAFTTMTGWILHEPESQAFRRTLIIVSLLVLAMVVLGAGFLVIAWHGGLLDPVTPAHAPTS